MDVIKPIGTKLPSCERYKGVGGREACIISTGP